MSDFQICKYEIITSADVVGDVSLISVKDVDDTSSILNIMFKEAINPDEEERAHPTLWDEYYSELSEKYLYNELSESEAITRGSSVFDVFFSELEENN